ncbi:hypothetical protein CJ030_MR3G026513 [Morella rubra]|uniref:AB hydrolase-1 domain-containing protein n=1 Tax=Morella rubra TaxID=262757 RepID=A0A6A1W181_9ROSI|nr:hypothetical protein CJ030_MR3G026513 [Morella rubra]
MAKGGLERLRRIVRTVFFMVAMVASLLVSSLPVLVALGDVLVPFVLISSFTCFHCYSFKEHLRRYAFKSSLTDIPLVSVVRSLVIICVYSMCDAPALSHGPYLGTVTLCSFVSIILLSIKVCVFSVNSQIEAEVSSSLYRQKLHVKKSWGMPVLFLSSVVFALGHTVVAYRTSCRARRKLMFHRVDPEAKVPRSPTPSGGKTPKSDDGSATPVLSEEIPVLSLDDTGVEGGVSRLSSRPLERGSQANGQFGVVLVHGFGGGVFSWRNVMGSLARQVGCTVAAFDRPGWGLTSRPRRKDWEENELPNPFRLESQIDLLLAFCSEMGFSSVVLVGHDDGGLLALKAAQRVQSSMNSFNIVIQGVVLLSVSLTREVVPAFARILLHTSLGKKHLVRPLLRAEVNQVINRRAWYDASKLTTEVLSLYKAPLCVEGWDEGLHEIGRLSSETALSLQNADSLIKAIEDIPVLVITGAEDALVSLKSSQAMAVKFVNSPQLLDNVLVNGDEKSRHITSDRSGDCLYHRLVAISGCGHLPHEECPKALLAAISPFIGGLLFKPDLESL